MSTISLKLPSVLAKKVETEAKRSGRSKSEVVRDALEKSFRKDGRKKATFYDLTSHLAGCGSGPGDLSTNKTHMSDYGE